VPRFEQTRRRFARPADWQSAIQQTGSLRYGETGERCHKDQPAAALPGVWRLGVLALCAALLAGCSKPATDSPPPAAADEAPRPQRIKYGSTGEVIVAIDAPTQATMGLRTAALEAIQLPREAKAYGRVLDISALAGLVSELTSSRAAAEASQAELARLKTLSAQNNASARALQAAEAAAVKDQAQVESVRLRLLANWGSAIAERQDLPAFVQSLGALDSALVEADLPPGQPLATKPTAARLFSLLAPDQPIPAKVLGPAQVVDPMMQGRGFLLLVSPNTARLAPGGSVTAFLSLEGDPQPGLLLPRSAIVRNNGTTYVYFETSPETFQKTEVALGPPLEGGWFIRQPLKPGDKVVTVGAQQLLSEELNTEPVE